MSEIERFVEFGGFRYTVIYEDQSRELHQPQNGQTRVEGDDGYIMFSARGELTDEQVLEGLITYHRGYREGESSGQIRLQAELRKLLGVGL